MNKRELEDNLNLKKFEKEQTQFEGQISELDEKISKLNYSELTEKKESLLRSQNESLLEKASTEGEIKQLQVIYLIKLINTIIFNYVNKIPFSNRKT